MDITLAPQPGAFKAQRSPQPGSVVVLTSACPPPRQALDWLSAAPGPGGAAQPRGQSPAPRSRGPTPDPVQEPRGVPAGNGGQLRRSIASPSPSGGSAAAGADDGALQHGSRQEASEGAALAMQSGRVARRMRHAPPDLDGAAAGVGMQASEAAAAQPGSMLSQIADCLDDDDEDGEISEAAAEAASLAAEAAVCSIEHRRPPRPGGAAAWLEPKDILRADSPAQEGITRPQAQQQQGGEARSEAGGSSSAQTLPEQRLVIAGVRRPS